MLKESEALFDRYDTETKIEKALARKVWLKSGGYVIIDRTEALTSIDVNSGKFVGKDNLEKTITAVNCEAARITSYNVCYTKLLRMSKRRSGC